MKIAEKYIVFDIETDTQGRGTADPELDILKYVGFKYGDKHICYHYTQREEIQKTLSWGTYLVGHNIKTYDKRVLERHGFKFNYKQVLIDTYEISENRLKSMMYLDLNTGDKSLSSLCERFNLIHKKGSFDYSLLSKDSLEGEEYRLLVEYLFGDLDSADDLFNYYYEFFYGFREMVSKRNQENFRWLTSSSGSNAYMVICNQLNLKEEYDDTEEKSNVIQGAYVLQPTVKMCKGRIEYRDGASLYPHCYIMGNLFSPISKNDPNGWNGSGVFPSIYANELDGVKGTYSRIPGKMELFLKHMYDERVKIKKEMKKFKHGTPEYLNLERKQLAYKICLNSAYGACNNRVFKNIYNETTASDCTAIARRVTKYAKTVLEENGYEVLYIDTDGIFVNDVYNDPNKLDKVFSYIREKELESANVRVESHGFKIETVIKYICFFENDEGDLNKKSYIYIDENDEIHEKGIRIVRGDCSPIAKQVYETYIKPKVFEMNDMVISEEQLTIWLREEIKKNPDKLKKRYRLKDPSTYKIADGKDEATGLHYQLAKKYGSGEFYFVVNRRIGPGKGNHYCTLEELQSKYDNWIDQIKLDTYITDLKCFISKEERKTRRKKND